MFILDFEEEEVMTLDFGVNSPFGLFWLTLGFVGSCFGVGGFKHISFNDWGFGVGGLVRFGWVVVGQQIGWFSSFLFWSVWVCVWLAGSSV